MNDDIAPHYSDDEVTVWHGDCLDILRSLPDNSADSVVTDPPYNLSFMAKPWDAYEGHEDAGFAYWLSGLIDGEGHFAIKAHTRGTHAPMFALKMRADERGTLERIRRSLGVGVISDEPREPNPMVKYVIQDKAGCQRLVDLLDKYPLRAKKQIDYWTWRDAVCEWTSRPRGNRWVGATDNAGMATKRARLMENRAYTDVPWSGHEFQDWCRLWATECLRVLKPGGHILAFGGTRTSHRLACAIEDAGFEIRDALAWLYASGFPKSLDVPKAIDRAAGAERDRVPRVGGALNSGTANGWSGSSPDSPGAVLAGTQQVGEPITDDARTWQGWGTALKPAYEPIVMGRKPLVGTVAGNVLAHGTGALNIDGCRIGDGGQLKWATPRGMGSPDSFADDAWTQAQGRPHAAATESPVGRWPANVMLDEHQAKVLDEQSGILTSGANPTRRGSDKFRDAYGDFAGQEECVAARGADSGGASRFFYVAKAPQSERIRVDGVAHPTVKPLGVMQWLVRLVTPRGGVVLEPFAGSGTTIEACLMEGFRCIAIEREAEYLPLIAARIVRRGRIKPTARKVEPATSAGQLTWDMPGGDV